MAQQTVATRAPASRDQIVEAALESLKEDGYAGTSARSIARRRGFSQALIFYHFGTLNQLLLAALDRTSEERMARYAAAVAGAESLEDLLGVALGMYREDLEAGHMTVFSELIAASMAHPDLKQEMVARMRPWLRFAERTIANVLEGSPLTGVVPIRQLAFAIVAFYCGVNMLSTLEHDRSETEALFQTGRSLAPVLSGLLGAPAGRSGG